MEKKYQIVLSILFFIFLTFLSFLFSPFFHIRDFVFHSRNEINKNELRFNINKFYGDNLLFLNENELKNFKEVIFKDLGKLHKNLEFLYNEDRTKENYDNLILINNIIIQ